MTSIKKEITISEEPKKATGWIGEYTLLSTQPSKRLPLPLDLAIVNYLKTL